VLPVHVDLDVADIDATVGNLADQPHRHAKVAHEDAHSRLAVLVFQKHFHAAAAGVGDELAHAVDEVFPHARIVGLEGIVVAFCPRPDDEMRFELRGHVDAGLGRVERALTQSALGIDERAQSIGRHGEEPQRQAVDVLVAEDALDRLDVVLVDLGGVVVLETVDEVAQAGDGPLGALFHAFGVGFGVVATGHEPRRVGPEGPDAAAILDPSTCHGTPPHSPDIAPGGE